MDMSNKWLREPASPVRTAFPALVAALRAAQAQTPCARLSAVAPACTSAAGTQLLAHLLLARPGWRDAARSLEGRFDLAADGSSPAVTCVTGAFTTRLEPSFSPPR